MSERPGDDVFEEDAPAARLTPEVCVVDLDGFEGPLDVLLSLAREQKVDLTRISILQLADQYLAFVELARHTRLDLAAEYLVMAAWLAYLKSKLLLPEREPDQPTAEQMAARLSFQLRRLEAMREAAAQLMTRPRLGLEVFGRGGPSPAVISRRIVYRCSYYELLAAYSRQRTRQITAKPLRFRRDLYLSVDDALQRLRSMLNDIPEWAVLQRFLPDGLTDAWARRCATAATFAASLELAKRGAISLRQGRAFGPIYVRRMGPGG